MYSCYDAVMDGNVVYDVREGDVATINSYNAISDNWSQLPDSVYKSGSITVVSGWLTTVMIDTDS